MLRGEFNVHGDGIPRVWRLIQLPTQRDRGYSVATTIKNRHRRSQRHELPPHNNTTHHSQGSKES